MTVIATTRPATTTAATTAATTTARASHPAGRRTTPLARSTKSRPTRSAFRMTPPPAVTAWESLLPSLPVSPDAGVVASIVELVRAGQSRDQVQAAVAVTGDVLTEVVVDLGSKCAQMNKRGPKIKSIRRGGEGEVATFTREGDVISVRTAPGWAGEDGTADIRRAYAALLSSDQTLVMNAVARWSEVHTDEQPLKYTHVADLYSSARGLLPDLSLVIDHPSSIRAYLQAWRLLDDAAHHAMRGIAHLTSGRATASSARAAIRACFWILPQAGHLDRLAAAVESAPTSAARMTAEARLYQSLTQLRAHVETRPARFMPRTLGDLSTVQVRAVAARHGLFVDDGSNSRAARSLDGFAADVEEARTRMAAGMGDI